MKAKTEEFLYYLLWFTDTITSPTWRNLDSSFESWAYRNGFLRQIQRLEQQQYIEKNRSKTVKSIYRLSEKGKLHAMAGRDPASAWDDPWDGKWRTVMFDIPRVDNAARNLLRTKLKADGFGCLQQSVWVSPRPLTGIVRELCESNPEAGTIITMESVPLNAKRNADIVSQSWDFDTMNETYRKYEKLLKSMPTAAIVSSSAATAFRNWANRERTTWKKALDQDPLLPGELLPRGYLGRRTWQKRKSVLSRAAQLIASANI